MANRYTLKTGNVYKILEVKDGTTKTGARWQLTKIAVPNADPAKKERTYQLWTSEVPHTLGTGDSAMITSLGVTDGWKKDQNGEFKPDISYEAVLLPTNEGHAPTFVPTDDNGGLPF